MNYSHLQQVQRLLKKNVVKSCLGEKYKKKNVDAQVLLFAQCGKM